MGDWETWYEKCYFLGGSISRATTFFGTLEHSLVNAAMHAAFVLSQSTDKHSQANPPFYKAFYCFLSRKQVCRTWEITLARSALGHITLSRWIVHDMACRSRASSRAWTKVIRWWINQSYLSTIKAQQKAQTGAWTFTICWAVKLRLLICSTVQGDPYCREKHFESLPVGRILNQANLIKFAKERQPLGYSTLSPRN